MRRGNQDEGQAAVELALVLPLVMTLLLGLVQVALVVRDQLLVAHAAREAARAAAVDSTPEAAGEAAMASAPLIQNRLAVTADGSGATEGRVRVTVRYLSPTVVPLVGSMVGDVSLSSSVTMRVEHPSPGADRSVTGRPRVAKSQS